MRVALALLFAAGCTFDPDPLEIDLGAHVDAARVVDGGSDGIVANGPYPIVLVHGFAGFDHIGTLDYFYGVADALTKMGRSVYTVQLGAYASTTDRGPALQSYVQYVLDLTGADKVVLIAHSQGGLDARWVAHVQSSAIAAIVTIGTPHRGTVVADAALGLTPLGLPEQAFSALAGLFTGSAQNVSGALAALSTPVASAFNAATPDSPDVAYYSIAGRSLLRASASCGPSAPFLVPWDHDLDPLDPALAVTGTLLATADLPSSTPNDGLVDLTSARWGTFLGCIPADHINEVCQIAGQSPGLGNDFDCLAFYRGLVTYLAAHGY